MIDLEAFLHNPVMEVLQVARIGATILTCDEHFERIGRVGSIVVPA
jgi:hypothetical protein